MSGAFVYGFSGGRPTARKGSDVCRCSAERPSTIRDAAIRGGAAMGVAVAITAAAAGSRLNLDALSILPQNANAAAIEWSYNEDAPDGPSKWGEFFPDCNGKQQSPISICTSASFKRRSNVQGLVFYDRRPSRFRLKTIHSNPHFFCDSEETWKCGGIRFKGEKYALKQMHMHTPAENVFDGSRGDAELHLVHIQPDTGKILVVGLVFESSPKANEQSGKEVLNILKDLDKGQFWVSPKTLLHTGREGYFQWQGSLTTPPCSEKVTWVLVDKKYKISPEAVKILRQQTVTENARPVLKNINPVSHYSSRGGQ
ncbi:hypothetical protein NDN08_001312 [Rhodosorus marinus]|uniref:carbonic anhydrase n=1 Tax=Rhodosorus marinus TaxID=101924 RepID=A0AAV8UUK1_9RHOD|nr:hypothetical protein NDN08_001312 [Rhodosorus marinus]